MKGTTTADEPHALAAQADEYVEWLATNRPDRYELLLFLIHSKDVQPDSGLVLHADDSADRRARREAVHAAIRRRERGRAREGQSAACDRDGVWQRTSYGIGPSDVRAVHVTRRARSTAPRAYRQEANTRPRARQRRETRGRRSSGGGDSGSSDSDSSEPPPAGRRCLCGCGLDISHRAPQARYLNDAHAAYVRQRRKRTRARDWNPDVSGRDPYLRFDLEPPKRFEDLRKRIEDGCRCNGDHIADPEDRHCCKCGHRRGEALPFIGFLKAASAETRRLRKAVV